MTGSSSRLRVHALIAAFLAAAAVVPGCSCSQFAADILVGMQQGAQAYRPPNPPGPASPTLGPNPVAPTRPAGVDAYEPDDAYPHSQPGLQFGVWQHHTIFPAGDVDHVAWVPLPAGWYSVEFEPSGAPLRAWVFAAQVRTTLWNQCVTDKLVRVEAPSRSYWQDFTLKPRHWVLAPQFAYSAQVYELGPLPQLVATWPNADSGFTLTDDRGKVVLTPVPRRVSQIHNALVRRGAPWRVGVFDDHPILVVMVKAERPMDTGTYRIRLRR